jgi:uncharacterized membrane protein YidH (DUF202 family)
MRSLVSEVWLAAVFSALSAAAFLWAMLTGWRLADVRSQAQRQASESQAALAAVLAVLLVLVAVVFWIAYFIFGPLHDAGAGLLHGD